MTIETEAILIKLLEELKAESKETNRKLDKFIETTNQSLTSIQVNQGIQGEQIKSLQKGQEDLKADLSTFKAETKENFKEVRSEIKEVRSELKETRNDVSGLYKWVIGLIITLGIGIITLGIGVVTIIFRVFDLFPQA